jgi:uncharacterized membrane protein YkoI
MRSITRMLSVLLVAVSSWTTNFAVRANETPWHEHGSAYEQAREAVRLGKALPLKQVRAHLQQIVPGKVVSTHYEFEFDRWVYEFKLIDPQGRLRKVHLDARTGELVKVSDF